MDDKTAKEIERLRLSNKVLRKRISELELEPEPPDGWVTVSRGVYRLTSSHYEVTLERDRCDTVLRRIAALNIKPTGKMRKDALEVERVLAEYAMDMLRSLGRHAVLADEADEACSPPEQIELPLHSPAAPAEEGVTSPAELIEALEQRIEELQQDPPERAARAPEFAVGEAVRVFTDGGTWEMLSAVLLEAQDVDYDGLVMLDNRGYIEFAEASANGWCVTQAGRTWMEQHAARSRMSSQRCDLQATIMHGVGSFGRLRITERMFAATWPSLLEALEALWGRGHIGREGNTLPPQPDTTWWLTPYGYKAMRLGEYGAANTAPRE